MFVTKDFLYMLADKEDIFVDKIKPSSLKAVLRIGSKFVGCKSSSKLQTTGLN